MIRSSLLMMVAGGLIFICGVNYGRNHNPTKCWYTMMYDRNGANPECL